MIATPRVLVLMTAFMAANAAHAATVTGGSGGVDFSGVAGIISVRINGPDGLALEILGSKLTSVSPLPDGQYQYEITGALDSSRLTASSTTKAQLNNGRSELQRSAARAQPVGVIDWGGFQIVNGSVPDASLQEEAP